MAFTRLTGSCEHPSMADVDPIARYARAAARAQELGVDTAPVALATADPLGASVGPYSSDTAR